MVDPPHALAAPFRPEIDDPIRAADDVENVLDALN
jgi:hypothetical protein